MANNLLITFKADTRQYDANVAKAKRQLEGFASQNFTAGGAMQQLTATMVGTAARFASLGAAISAAGKVLKDTFTSTESNVDSFGRTMQSAKSLYEGFLTSINTGSVSGFLDKIDNIVEAARNAYDAMDELSSFSIRYNPKNQLDMQQIDKLMKEARALMAKGDKEGARAKTTEATQIAEQAKKNTVAYGEKEYTSGMSTLKDLLGRTGVEFSDAQIRYYSDPANWEKAKAAAARYKKTLEELEAAQSALHAKQSWAGTTGAGEGSLDAARERVRAAESAFNALSNSDRRAYIYMNTRDSGEKGQAFATATSQIYGRERAQYAVDAIQARIDRTGAMATKVGGGGGGGKSETLIEGGIKNLTQFDDTTVRTSESMSELEKELRRFQTALSNASNAAEYRAAETGIADVKRRMSVHAEAMSLGVSTDSMIEVEDEIKAWIEAMRDKLPKLEITPVTNPTGLKEAEGDGKMTAQAWQSAASAINSAGGALQSLDDPSAKIAGIVGQAVANIALGFAQAAASPATGAAGVFGWIAAATAGLATMVSTIASIKSVTSGNYAEGGIIPGNSYSGDNLRLYGVNSGELILNRAQQNNLAGALTGGSLADLRLETVLSGEQIRVVLNRNGQRRGVGEYVTSHQRY